MTPMLRPEDTAGACAAFLLLTACGGASVNGNASGAGGNGGNGLCVIIEYYGG